MEASVRTWQIDSTTSIRNILVLTGLDRVLTITEAPAAVSEPAA